MSSEVINNFKLEEGCTLTIRREIVSQSGTILFKAGQKVTCDSIDKTDGHYGRVSGCWIKEHISGVRLVGHTGIWFLSCFVETDKISN